MIVVVVVVVIRIGIEITYYYYLLEKYCGDDVKKKDRKNDDDLNMNHTITLEKDSHWGKLVGSGVGGSKISRVCCHKSSFHICQVNLCVVVVAAAAAAGSQINNAT